MAAGAAGGALGAALYGGSPEQILQAAIKGAVIRAISSALFYGVGEYFGPAEDMSTSSQVESMAAHGVVGGAKEAAEGGNFWKGFVATAATKASSLYGPNFNDITADTARAAVVGGTVAQLDGGKFANGAILGAFSYAFNDYAHTFATYGAATGSAIAAGGSAVVDVATGGVNLLATPEEVAGGGAIGGLVGYGFGSLLDAFTQSSGTPPEFDFYDPTNPPSRPGGQEWEWRGKQPVGGPEGGWANPDESRGRESVKPDMGHPDPIGPHWDWNDCRGNQWRCFPDGRIEPK